MLEEEIKKLLGRRIDEKLFPGAVFGGVARNGKRIVIPAGRHTYEPDSTAVTEETVYDVASVTKVIPTASLAMQLIDENKLSPEDKLIKYVPEFGNSDRERVLIKHLLTFTLDFNFKMSGQKDKSPEEILDTVYTTDFKSPPGSKFFYHNASSLLLGMVIEKICGESLDKLADERFFVPLKMKKTTLFPLVRFKQEEIVPTEIDEWRGREVRGEVHDESAFALRAKVVSGNAGVFSTVPDLLNFMEMLINDGKMAGKRYFSEMMITHMESDQIPKTGVSHGWGYEVNNPTYMGKTCGIHTFAKTGFTGCVVGADRQKELAWVLLSNCKYPHRTDNTLLMNQTRCEIADMLFSAGI